MKEFGKLETDVWPAAGRNWEWRLEELAGCGRVLVVRRAGDDTDFVVGVERGTPLNPRNPDLEDGVRLALEQRRIGRGFGLNDAGAVETQNPTWRLFLSVGGTGSWQDLHGPENYLSQTPFRWADKKTTHDENAIWNWLQKPAAQWLEWAQNELKNPDSPLCFARRWHTMDGSAKNDFVLGLSPQNLPSYRATVHAILRSHLELWAQNSVVTWHLSNENIVRLSNRDNEWRPPKTIEKWAKLLDKSYRIPLTPLQLETHVALKEASQWHRRLTIQTERPTAHEQLEARLELRDWLQSHFSDENLAGYFD